MSKAMSFAFVLIRKPKYTYKRSSKDAPPPRSRNDCYHMPSTLCLKYSGSVRPTTVSKQGMGKFAYILRPRHITPLKCVRGIEPRVHVDNRGYQGITRRLCPRTDGIKDKTYVVC